MSETLPYVPTHCKTSFVKRSNIKEMTVQQAWEESESVSVDFPDYSQYSGRGRLHGPAGVILVYHPDLYTDANCVIKTVLDLQSVERDVDLVDDHLEVHGPCGWRYDPSEGGCPWCEHGYGGDGS